MSRRIFIFIALCVLPNLACESSLGLRIGPFPIAVDAGEGEFSSGLLGLPVGLRGTYDVEHPVCQLPTEEQVQKIVHESAGDAFSSHFTLTDIPLTNVTFTALQGDFRSITDVELFFQPKPRKGRRQSPVRIGSARSASGFGVEINVAAEGGLDLLRLVRENDENPSEECNAVLIRVTGRVPERPIRWFAEVFGDAYGILGL